MLTSFPTEQGQDKKVKAEILADTFCSPWGMVVKGQQVTVDHHEFLLLKAAGKAVLAKDRPKARPANDDDVAFIKLRGYAVESTDEAQKFLDQLAGQGTLGGYLAELGKWVKDGRPTGEDEAVDEIIEATEAESTKPAEGEVENVPVAPAEAAPAKQARKK